MTAIKRALIFAYIDVMNSLQGLLVRSTHLYKLMFVPGIEGFRRRAGRWRAWRMSTLAYRKVPAYRRFLDERGGYPQVPVHGLTPDLSVIPEMDKETYIQRYSSADRCLGGVIPSRGVMVDESSGSSGKPTSWVRGWREREVSKHTLQMAYHSVLGGENAFVINAFALGAWATGLNVSMCLSEVTVMKSTGPDIDKIVHTIQEFGTAPSYIVMGYPPFLKTLADDPRIDWSRHDVSVAYGGEGMSESMRDYLLRSFRDVYGSYGASDLEINIATENELTVTLRKLILERDDLRKALVWTDLGVTPMLFQYNPLAYYIETNELRELVITLARPTNISPRIRYNIHDVGHVLSYAELLGILDEHGVRGRLGSVRPRIQLPFLFHYGRSDMSIDYFGANVTPDSVREVLEGIDALAPVLHTFRLRSYEDEANDQRMSIEVELVAGAPNDLDAEAIRDETLGRLADMNRDFANAYRNTASEEMHPELTIHPFGTGPFEGGQRKLKHQYVETGLEYDAL